MRSAAGALRAHWDPLVRALHGDGLARSSAGAGRPARRLIHENGVTYNVYGDPRGMDRPWELDPIPLVLPRREWERARAGARAARAPARRDPRRSLRAAAPAARRAPAGGAGVRAPDLPASVSRRAHPRRVAGCSSTPPTSRARPTGVVGARRSHAGAVGRGLRAREPPGGLAHAAPRRSARAASSGWRASSSACATRCARSRRATATIRASRCSRPGPTTRPTSSTPTSRAISASRWSRAAT